MEKLLEIVNDRNAIVEGLDEDRLRYVKTECIYGSLRVQHMICKSLISRIDLF